MAGFGTTVDFMSAPFSMAFAKVINKNAVSTFGSVSPFFANVFSGVPENLKTTPFDYKGKMIRSSSGGALRLHWKGGPVNIDTVANPSDAATATYRINPAIAANAVLTRYNVQHQMDSQLLEYISGDEATIADYVQMESEIILDSFLAKVSNGFWGTGDQTQTTLGSFRRAISNSNSIGGPYLGIDRTDSGNSGLRGELMTAAAFSLARLREGIQRVRKNRGTADLALMSRINEDVIASALSAFDTVNDPAMVAKYGASYYNFRGCAVCMDGYAPDTSVAVMSTNTWVTSFNPGGIKTKPLTRDITKQQIVVMPCDLAVAVVCENPRQNCQILVS
jgi:hypothetical protein